NTFQDRFGNIHTIGALIPSYVQVSVTRNYGETANEKVNELLFKLFVATGFVFILVLWAFRAFKPAIVVLLVIPVVLLCTVFTAWAIDYTIDRVSLFALIFSIGILVDDAIVVVENIYSRWLHKGETDMATAIDAVREVGNPTILATFTVIAALGAMGFVSGMMGPYMRPIPVLGSAAMLISLFASFVFAPWLAMTKMLLPSMSYLKTAEEREEKMAERLDSFYRRILTSLYESKGKRAAFKLIMWGSLILFCSFFYFHLVVVKMLPLDNKPEFGVVLNLPEGTALPVSANLANQIAENLREMDEVTAVQIYVGTAKPYDFNGMVRHYYLRDKPWQAEVQVQLLNKTKRARSSHEIALEARDRVTRLVENNAPGTRFAVVEMPPGPPVLQTVVAEVHGPDGETRRQVARDMTGFFEQAPTLTDVDNLMKDDAYYWRFQVERDKAVRRGISVDVINRNLAMALGGQVLGDIKKNVGLESVNIVIQVPLAARSKIEGLNDLPIPTQTGSTVPLSELGHFERVREEPIIFKKDLRDVEFVTAEVHGKLSAPVYGMFEVQDELANVKPDGYKSPDGMDVSPYWFEFLTPSDDSESWIEWTGEWTVTYETFRDMGGAFILAIIIIYMLVVWEFGNFRVPALIMAPIPLTLLGIIPAHAVLGAAFTATSMIGWIALAGIIVRNSILLVDYSIHEIQKGVPVMDAVVGSCKARTRPIVITAVALMAGASVILPDPIFNGMAISLVFGVAVSTVLTLVVIPLGCLTASHSLCEVAVATYEGGGVCPVVPLYPAKPKQNTASPGVPIWMRLWSGLFTVVSMIFYLIRGLFLMLGQFFKKTPPSKPAAPAKPAAVSSVVTASDEAKATSGVKPQVAEAKPLKPQPLAGQESAVQSGSAAEDTAPATKRLDDAEKTVNAEPKSEDTTVSASNHENETVTAVFDSEEEATSVAAMTPKKKAPSRKKAAKKTAKKAAKKASKKVLRKKPVVRKKVRVRQSEDETSSQQTNGRRGIRLLDDHDDDDGIL
ncbi:MAG: efflux RND transporter permease subunit, partial [gamma proteobacterium symbiont of Bathyaustriella thionipta]|nr:efflux RND transporter permease subunit [gamma proteobacterium symbiont of Bathyaustriella thionipta]